MSSDKKDNTNDKNTTRKETGKVANLKVAEVAEQRDVGRKIARIDPDIAERLNTGDALELPSLGKKSTVLNFHENMKDAILLVLASQTHNENRNPLSYNE